MPSALALFAHPDDIEFRAAGTLLQLKRRGWDIHYCNLANGNLGSAQMTIKETEMVRRAESKRAAQLLGATWHRSFCNDLQIVYSDSLIRRVCALVRQTKPSILLTHPTQDYMEDHMITARLAITGAFARGIPNYRSTPQRSSVLEPLTIYHSMPHGLLDPLRRRVEPECYVDVTDVQGEKVDALCCHRSQKHWLDLTQGPDSYLCALDSDSRELGDRSGKFHHAEAWTRHLHLGFGAESDNPLKEALGDLYLNNPHFAP